MTATSATEALSTIPGRYASPDPSTLAAVPKGGTNLLYMGHAEVTLALIDVDPEWGWRPAGFDANGSPQIEEHGKRLVMWGYLTLLGVERLCVGTCEAHKADPEKELVGDLLRNGAMRFGIGTKLWSKAGDADPAGSGVAGRRHPQPAPSQPQAGPTAAQIAKMQVQFGQLGIKAREDKLVKLSVITGRTVSSSKDLTGGEARQVIDALEAECAAEFAHGFNTAGDDEPGEANPYDGAA